MTRLARPMRIIGLKNQLLIASLMLSLCASFSAISYLEWVILPLITERFEHRLVQHARSARETLSLNTTQNTEDMDALVVRLARTIEARITIVNQDGSVDADSHIPLESIPKPQTAANYPEIGLAMESGVGIARHHATHQPIWVNVAVPHRGGVIRVSTPVTQLDNFIHQLRLFLWIVVGFCLLSVLAIHNVHKTLFSRVIKRIVRHIESVSHQHLLQVEPSQSLSPEQTQTALNQLSTAIDTVMATYASSRNRFDTVLSSIGEGVIVVDNQQRVLLANPEALRILGLRSPPLGQDLSDAVCVSPLIHLMERSQLGRVSEIILLNENTSGRYVMTTAIPLHDAEGSVIVMHDVTDIRRLENIRKDFVANVSHELRTPVSIVQANAETLLDGALEDPERARTFVEALHRNAERLSRIIGDLLDLSRLEAGRYRFDISQVDVSVPVHQAVQTIQARAQQREQSIEVSILPEQRVKVDPKVLEQVLLNLLENSIKYTPNGGHVVVRAGEQGDLLRLEVQDDGPGIRAEHRARVFERFYRIDPGRSRDMGGTGLGLAIVKHLVESMGGNVGVEPAFPRGSIFWITLPVENQLTHQSSFIERHLL
ncbi:MAG: PAS domain-containing protein [Myxococcales bacterium]|nr:PAS domain-containing protein [Myxococcales bacterium]